MQATCGVADKSVAEKIALFQRLFSGRTDVYGTSDLTSGLARQEEPAVAAGAIRAHLEGRQPYGVYALVRGRSKFMAVDFDKDDRGIPRRFVAAARRCGTPSYVERSK